MKKQSKAFMINKETYAEFRSICKSQGLVMSVLIENFIKDWVKNNQLDEQ